VTTRSHTDQRPTNDPPDSASDSTAGAEIIGILDTVTIPIVVVGRDCTLVRFNRAAKDMFSFAVTDLGLRLGSINALADVKDVEALCGQAMADEAPCRRDIRSADRWFLLQVAPYSTAAGQIAGAVLTFTNVTAFRASIEQAVYEREYTKAILNSVATPLVVLDGELRVQSGNRAFYTMFGVAREKAHGVPLRELGNDEWKGSRLWPALTAMVPNNRDFQPLEVERDFPSVGTRTVLIDARWVARDGGPTIVLAIQDVTEHKRTEQILQEADRRKDEFLALLAHELRNPLAPIRTGLELIRVSGDTPQAIRRVRSMMERQVSHMVRLIDDLLDISRIASGKIILQRVPTTLTELVQSAIEAQRAAIEAAKIALTVVLPSEPCVVDVDPARFVQVLSNVLHNASKFTPANGEIRCAAEMSIGHAWPLVNISVSDTGAGISPAMLPRVFDLFAQGEAASERAHGGLGIGLALARRLIEMHGGTITAQSDGPGQGSVFTITIPMCDAPARPSTTPGDVPRVASRAVIIDDNADAAHAMSMLIEELGGAARIAHDAASGLEVVQQFQPDIVFLDIGMPGTDGYEACRQLRCLRLPKRMLIVAVTGWGQPQDKQRALDAGFDAHLVKPVDPAILTRVLARQGIGPSG
jgi:two-component system CheB/CheR fusion protein